MKSMKVVVLISANVEWQAVLPLFPGVERKRSPFGEWFERVIPLPDSEDHAEVIFLHGGWGKIAAAASTQYAIDRWHPDLLVNLGTCGGFEGEVERGTILLVDRTLVYDIVEQMGDFDEHIAHYTTVIDLDWLGSTYPQPVLRSLLVSGDRDLMVGDIPELKGRYGAVAGDWESGAIAFVASHNTTRVLILRGVTDLVSSQGGEAYGNIQMFALASAEVMKRLVDALPDWIALAAGSGES